MSCSGELWQCSLGSLPRKQWFRMRLGAAFRRARDLVVATFGLLVFSPLLTSIGLAILVRMRRPVLFRHRRAGAGGKPFVLYKFRTMTNLRGPDGRLLPDEARLTRLGRLLRQFSLDELPQLWNVLKGEMSLVGPRPLLLDYVDRYNDFQRRRLEVKPGITGWAQVNGRNALSWEQRFELDVWYVDHQSFWLDLKILWLTLLKAVRGEGISQPGHATMPEFMPRPWPGANVSPHLEESSRHS
jgi:sugar transferase EpsL